MQRHTFSTGIYAIIIILSSVSLCQGKEQQKSVVTEKDPSVYSVKMGETSLEIDALNGARIISFKLKNQEMLLSQDINPDNYGSTLWPSPQNWKWPPYPVLDRNPYRVRLNGNAITLTSEDDSVSGYRFTKTIIPDFSNNSYSITYTITNISLTTKRVSPWEVTRVPAGGTSFFPAGTPGGLAKSNLATEKIDGIIWFPYNYELVTGHQKLFMNGSEGWLANAQNGILFIKQFSDLGIEEEAPGETEIEIYANKDRTYVELENQGPYTSLTPGQSIKWEVKWYLRKIPNTIKEYTANNGLTAFVRKTIGFSNQAKRKFID